jgi:hypothetical protein
MKNHLKFWIKTSFTYGLLALSFSFIGIFLDNTVEPSNPLNSVSIEHVFGHIAWGMIAAIPALSFRYIVASGLFAILLDSDHLIQFLGFDMISRMGHSIPFAVIAAFSMLVIFGRKDYLLAAISFAAILSHISFDTFINSGKFPLFVPFDSTLVVFQSNEWLLILSAAIVVVASVKLVIFQKTRLEKKLSSENNR